MSLRVEQHTSTVEEEHKYVVVDSRPITETSLLSDVYDLLAETFSIISHYFKGQKEKPFEMNTKQHNLANQVTEFSFEEETIHSSAPIKQTNNGSQESEGAAIVPKNPEAAHQFNVFDPLINEAGPSDYKGKEIPENAADERKTPLPPPLPKLRHEYPSNIKLKVRQEGEKLSTYKEDPKPAEQQAHQSPIHSQASEAGPAQEKREPTCIEKIMCVLTPKLKSGDSKLQFTRALLEKFIPRNDLISNFEQHENGNKTELEITLKDYYKGTVSAKEGIAKGKDWVILYPSNIMKLTIEIINDELIITFNTEHPFSVSMLKNIRFLGPIYLKTVRCNSARITKTHAHVRIIGGLELKNSYQSFINNYETVVWEKA